MDEPRHAIQYALVGLAGVYVGDTRSMTDDEVRRAARSISGRVERYNRCPACEAWTTSGGQLREDIDCPAIKAELGPGDEP